MTDFMDTALNYQPGIRITPSSKWVMTNGTIQMDVCTVCAQPYREGHRDCCCPSNHPDPCDRPTYDQLKAQHDALVAALETALNTETAARIGSESGAMQGFDYKYHYDKIRRVLDQVK